MESIIFKKFNRIDDFLKREGKIGVQVQEIIERYQGSLLKNLISAKILKYINTKPKLFSLRILQGGIFFRFFGPKIGNCIYLIHPLKRKTNRIPPPELETALKRTKDFLDRFLHQ